MKKDKILAAQIGQRLKEFRMDTLKIGTLRLANKFNEDHPGEPIGRGQITNWEVSPGWEYIYWLERRCKLNLLWALKGDPHKPIRI